jgi:hypothetical protein
MKTIQISDFVHISSNDISFLKIVELKENKNNYMIIIFFTYNFSLVKKIIYWYFYERIKFLYFWAF